LGCHICERRYRKKTGRNKEEGAKNKQRKKIKQERLEKKGINKNEERTKAKCKGRKRGRRK
jgi:hypothetical protein